MADVERQLITKTIRTATMEAVVNRGVESTHFHGLELENANGTKQPAPGDVWDWMTKHLRKYRAVPSMQVFEARFPTWVHWESSDPLPVILDHFVRTTKRREAIRLGRAFMSDIDDWERVGDIEEHAFAMARELSHLVPTSNITRYSDSLSRLELYRQRKEDGVDMGVSLVFQELDDLTFGVQNWECCIIQGFLNIGKSTMGVAMAGKAYFERNQTPLILSLEMLGERLANRWDAMAAQMRYKAIKRMELTPEEEARWYEVGLRASDARIERDILIIDDLHKPSSDRIAAEVERWQPHFTIVDTVDEVRAPKNLKTVWEQQAHVARELKGIAQMSHRAVIGIAQSGRDAEKEGAMIGNIAGSIDIARKADMVIGLHASDEMKKMKQMEVRALKLRDDGGVGSKFLMYWDPATMDLRTWKDEDRFKEKGTDA